MKCPETGLQCDSSLCSGLCVKQKGRVAATRIHIDLRNADQYSSIPIAPVYDELSDLPAAPSGGQPVVRSDSQESPAGERSEAVATRIDQVPLKWINRPWAIATSIIESEAIHDRKWRPGEELELAQAYLALLRNTDERPTRT